MKLGIMQPYFFPYIGYWQLINAVDKYVVYDDVNFIKGGWINRNNILLNGSKHLITIPLEKASPFKLINEISVTGNEVLKNKLIKTIKSAYIKAPFYEQVMPQIETLIFENSSISELNFNIILTIQKYLDIQTEIFLSSQIKKNNELKGQDKVIDIVHIMGAEEYINAMGGQELYSKDNFAKEKIKLSFLKPNEIRYKQFKNIFVPNLSIIDVMMFNSPEQIKDMLDDYTLV